MNKTAWFMTKSWQYSSHTIWMQKSRW